MRLKLILPLFLVAGFSFAQQTQKLEGTVIGTDKSVDYNASSSPSTTVNTRECAFDGKLDTYFASYDRSRTWVGMDLGTKHVITKVRWSPRNDSVGPKRMVLAVFEGANEPDFMDAVPLYINMKTGTIGQYDEAKVDVSRGFRYVRYVGPNDARCNVAEVEFYGYESEGDDSHLYQVTNLPTLNIHVANNQEPYDKEHQLESRMTLIYDNGAKLQDYPILTRLRGNASINFPKKPYRIKFNDDKKHHMLNDSELKAPAKAKKWTVINNYGDKTLMRNIIAFDISRRFGMAYTPWIQPVDVIVNGEYRGTYQLCDQIEVNKNRVNITEMHTDSENITGGYLIESDAYYYNEPLYYKSSRSNVYTYKSPDADSITAAQRSYINSYISKAETKVYSTTYKNLETGFRSMYDLESWIKYLLTNELSGNPDATWSTYMYKDVDDPQFHFGPVWDFDIAFDNDDREYPLSNRTEWLYKTCVNTAGQMRNLFTRILSDNAVVEDMKNMWIDARRNRGIDADTLCQVIDSMAAYINQSQELNFTRWNILNTRVHQNPIARGSYQAEVDALKSYIRTRVNWIDNKLGYDPLADDIREIAVDHITTNPSDVYNLSGQKVSSKGLANLPKGIYIVAGKKIIW